MPHLSSLLGFALVSLGMVLTPGPNMIYVISRSIAQGRGAGLISLGGVALGFVFCPMPTTRCGLAARCICYGWPGRC